MKHKLDCCYSAPENETRLIFSTQPLCESVVTPSTIEDITEDTFIW